MSAFEAAKLVETAGIAIPDILSHARTPFDTRPRPTSVQQHSMPGNSRFAVSLHILAYLVYRAGTAVPSAEIAASVDTNPVVIRRLLSALSRGGLVTAQKGAAGGFALAHAPAEISLLDVYRAVEPRPDQGLRRFAPNPECPVGAKIENILHTVFEQAQAGMEAALRQVTLADMHAQLRAVCPPAALAAARAS